MSLFSFFSNKKLGLDWQYEVKGLLWRIVVSEDYLLIGEDRNPSEKNVSFFCLRSESGEPLWERRNYSEQWWIGIETVHRQTLILHEYASPDMPAHKKIIAVDIQNGECLWRNDDLMFAGVSGESVYGRKDLFSDERLIELDLRTGRVIGDVADDAVAGIQLDSLTERPGLSYPATIAPGEPAPPALQRYLRRRRSGPTDIAGVEYLTGPEVEVCSWYERPSGAGEPSPWRQMLTVLNREGTTCHYTDVISENAAIPVPDSFFAARRHIIYTKGRNLLRSVAVERERRADANN